MKRYDLWGEFFLSFKFNDLIKISEVRLKRVKGKTKLYFFLEKRGETGLWYLDIDMKRNWISFLTLMKQLIIDFIDQLKHDMLFSFIKAPIVNIKFNLMLLQL